MKYRCKVCGEVISSPVLCPFCGSGSDEIEKIEEDLLDDTSESIIEEDVVEETFSNEDTIKEETHHESSQDDFTKILNNESSNEEVNSYIYEDDDKKDSVIDDLEVLVEDNCESLDDKTAENEFIKENEKTSQISENPAELEYFFKIFGNLYLNDIDKFNKFKPYFEYFVTDQLVKYGKNFDINSVNENDFGEFFKTILNQIKGINK